MKISKFIDNNEFDKLIDAINSFDYSSDENESLEEYVAQQDWINWIDSLRLMDESIVHCSVNIRSMFETSSGESSSESMSSEGNSVRKRKVLKTSNPRPNKAMKILKDEIDILYEEVAFLRMKYIQQDKLEEENVLLRIELSNIKKDIMIERMPSLKEMV
jgi:hypothetical protein